LREKIKKKLKSSSKTWIARHIRDEYVKAKETQGYRSRSAFKLLEIDSKFKIFRNKIYVLDLGSSPGGWSQVLSQRIKNGKIIAVDILPMEPIRNVQFILGDFLDQNFQKKIFEGSNKKMDIVLSDMASNTTGNKALDSYRTAELCLNAMELARSMLNNNGIFIAKFFMGESHKQIQKKANIIFKKVKFYKPNASRKDSKELYLICKNIIN